MTDFELGKEPHQYRPPLGSAEYAGYIRKLQEVSFAHRLWILQILYDDTLNNKGSDGGELSERLNVNMDEIRKECDILRRLGIIDIEHYADDGTPIDITLTGLAIQKIENAPIQHYDLLESDVKELQLSGNIKLKELEIERLKQETNLKKWEVWVNVTSTVQNASKWFSRLFVGAH